MGFFDKIKNAVNAVTGGAAKVSIQTSSAWSYTGDTLKVAVTATSSGGEVKSKGIFIDLLAEEEIRFKVDNDKQTDKTTTFSREFQIAPPFVLAPNDTKGFEGAIQIPIDVQPSYHGKNADHNWYIRGRVEALGNDPDSGFQPFTVVHKPV